MGETPTSQERWQKLMALASEQLNLVSLRQITAAGFSENVVTPRLRDQEWFKIHRGWFRIGGGPMSQDQRQLATQLIAGPSAVISHMTAARRHGLDVPRTVLIDITVPHGCRGVRWNDSRLYRTRDLKPDEVVNFGPIRVTSVTRTVIDLASVLKGQWLSSLVYSALRRGEEVANRLYLALLSQGPGRKGSRRVRALLERQTGEFGIPRSVAESFFKELADKTGVQPLAQYKLGPKQTVDFSFPAHKVVVEIDSWTHHASFLAYRTDRQRDVNTIREGWIPLRFTWHDVTTDRARVVSQILAVLATRSPQRELLAPASGTP